MVTGALKIKLFMGATKEGEIGKLGQALSIKQALSKMTDYIAQDLDHEGRVCAICHCNNPRRAQMVKEMLEERCRFQKFEMLEAGGVTTVYANDGGIVVSY